LTAIHVSRLLREVVERLGSTTPGIYNTWGLEHAAFEEQKWGQPLVLNGGYFSEKRRDFGR
jgi:hypothetical protein